MSGFTQNSTTCSNCQVGKFEWRKYSLNIEISEHMCACVRVCVCVFCALRYVKLALPFYECGGS
jgi:hypothetical protein